MPPTQPLIDRTKSVQALKSAIETFTAQVTADLEKVLRPLLEDGEEMPDLAFLQELLGRASDADLAAIVDAERKLDKAQIQYANHQRDRDDATEQLYGAMVHASGLVGHLHGKHKLGAFKGRLPRRAHPLLQLGRGLLQRFDRPREEWTAEMPEIVQALELTPDRWIVPIRKHTKSLAEAVDATTRAEARVATARVARKRALERFNRRFPDLARTLASLYRLSGHGELANSFQPSGQDPGLTLTQSKRRRAKRRKQTEASTAGDAKGS